MLYIEEVTFLKGFLLYLLRNLELPKTVYQDNWGHGPTLLSSKVTASQINDFTGTSNAW